MKIYKPATVIKVLRYLELYQEQEKRPPTIRELVKACGFKSTHGPDYQLGILLKAGVIDKRRGARGILLLGTAQERDSVLRAYLAEHVPQTQEVASRYTTAEIEANRSRLMVRALSAATR